jgi:hypothetical protein
MWNTIIGIVIALSGWMIVDAIMAVLYNPASVGTTWSSLITSGGVAYCLPQAGALPTDTLNQTQLSGISANGGVINPSGKSVGLCSSSNSACGPQFLQAMGFNSTQANVMSCIAATESSGIAATPPYNTTHPGSNSTACGTFQITKTTWNAAASGACSSFSNCQNATCNMQVARTLVSKSGYSSWTCAGCNNLAATCIQQYGGN